MKKGRFKTDYPAKPMRVHGALMNKVGSVLNSIDPGIPTANRNGMPGSEAHLPPLVIGVAEVTSLDSETHLPHVKFRYFDARSSSWKPCDSDPQLDPRIYSLSGNVSFGSVPSYKVGDVIPCLFHTQAVTLVPIQSPPDNSPASTVYSLTKVEAKRGDGLGLGTHDVASIVLELSINGDSWVPIGELQVAPDEPGQSVSGSTKCVALFGQYKMLRLRVGTSKYSRRILSVTNCGFSVRWLGRSISSTALNQFPGNLQSSGFNTVGGLLRIADAVSRFQDAPVVEIQADGLAALMAINGDPGNFWTAEITIFAEVVNTAVVSFAKITVPDNPNSEPSLNNVLTLPNSQGFHDAVLIQDYDGHVESEHDQKIWLKFVDNWAGTSFSVTTTPAPTEETPDPEPVTELYSGQVIAERGKVYGPIGYSGDVGTVTTTPAPTEETPDPEPVSDVRPVYWATIGLEEYFGYHGATLAKGESGTFRILDTDGDTDTDITKTAVCKWNPYQVPLAVAVIRRLGTGWVANPLECSKP